LRRRMVIIKRLAELCMAAFIQIIM